MYTLCRCTCECGTWPGGKKPHPSNAQNDNSLPIITFFIKDTKSAKIMKKWYNTSKIKCKM